MFGHVRRAVTYRVRSPVHRRENSARGNFQDPRNELRCLLLNGENQLRELARLSRIYYNEARAGSRDRIGQRDAQSKPERDEISATINYYSPELLRKLHCAASPIRRRLWF